MLLDSAAAGFNSADDPSVFAEAEWEQFSSNPFDDHELGTDEVDLQPSGQ